MEIRKNPIYVESHTMGEPLRCVVGGAPSCRKNRHGKKGNTSASITTI